MGIVKKTSAAAKAAGMDYNALQKKYSRQGENGTIYDWKGMQNAISERTASNKAKDTALKNKRKADLKGADKGTVSGRVKAAMGMEGFDDPMTQDMIKGSKFGEAVLGPEGLGRLGKDKTQEAMAAQAAELAKGFSSEEQLARQERGIEGIQGATAAQSRAAQAQLARSGVKGQAAGFNLAQIAASGVEARGNLERDLMIENRNAQMQGLQLQQGIHRDTVDQRKFDISQAAKEKDVALQAGLGFAQMGSVERGAAASAQAQIAAAKAGRAKSCFAEGTEILMADGSSKKIEDIELADYVKYGTVVYGLQQGLTDEIYRYKDVLVTGEHAVLEDGKWIRVKDSAYAEKEEGIYKVYNLSTSMHRIVTAKNFVFADFDETDFGSKIDDDRSLEVMNGKSEKILERGGRS